jgi:hypothetical protein
MKHIDALKSRNASVSIALSLLDLIITSNMLKHGVAFKNKSWPFSLHFHFNLVIFINIRHPPFPSLEAMGW